MFVKGSLVSVYANNGSLDEKYTRGEPLCMYMTIWVPLLLYTATTGALVFAKDYSRYRDHYLGIRYPIETNPTR